ncbi:DegT/DnrJ/EryC1/StrS family aminotransferase [Geomesophilobacter sediminis]|uniref:DegT/DnrJ/EryC1/StrS family aminotransferase n=1 Tax=Geomesophilobacter sediminis TaxID=2798584 RepID=A0A8J7JIK6_9BACT|nr:DegT/DnrJ/EryC1/StrS family aminotransferase [Geomesophilobacter sediminis]MBJ6724275.1 DegT/DnrJ/EryC1/StrS family aminotransferase [Geomesophilobacter sediminis]
MPNLAQLGGTPVRSNDRFLVYGAPLIEEAEIAEVTACLRAGWIGTGPRVHQFENDFRRYKGAKYSAALNSCTAGLHLAMFACGIGPGDEVITTPMTFCATVNAIIHCGATPVLADCDLTTMNVLPEEIERKITARTKAIIPVHFAGRCCDMEAIVSLARRYDLLVIEDCAHAIESEYRGKKAGTFGDIGCFSFYVTKNVVTGEGGMVITDDERLVGRIKTLGLHGMTKDAWSRFSDAGYKHYQVIHAGYKYNMTDMQAAMGIHQLARVEKSWERRAAIWSRYNEAFADLPCVIPADPEPDTRHAFHLYTVRIGPATKRDWVLEAMTCEGIGIGVHYVPVHLHPFYRKTFGWKEGDFPNAEQIGQSTLSLPLSPALSEEDVEDVITAFRKVAVAAVQ